MNKNEKVLNDLVSFLDISYYVAKDETLKKIIKKYYQKYTKLLHFREVKIISGLIDEININLKNSDKYIINKYVYLLDKANLVNNVSLKQVILKNKIELQKLNKVIE